MAIYKKKFIKFQLLSYSWMFTGKKPLDRIENIQKRALHFVLNDYRSSFHDLSNDESYLN